jgi:hypothetical protein
MTVRNSKDNRVLTISQDTWEKWIKLGLHRNWRILSSDKMPEPVKSVNTVTEFLSEKKKEEAADVVDEKLIKRKYERRKNAFERPSENAEQI